MKHRIADKKLNRDTKHRKALLKNLIASLFEHGEITTTEAKAKAIKGLVDKIIYKAQQGTIATRRVLAGFFGRRSLVNTVVDKVAPAMKDRMSGFTRIVRMGRRRGDNAMLVKMELIKKPEQIEKKEQSKKDSKPASTKTKAVAKEVKQAQSKKTAKPSKKKVEKK